MALADDFTNENLGKPVEVEDPSNVDQCMDWAFAWCDKLGIPRAAIRHLYAYQAFTLPNDVTRQYFDIVPNSLTYVPPAGALAIFGTSLGVAGHIALVLSGSTVFNLRTSDQNWDYKQYIQAVNHIGYRGVIGFLVPKVNQGDNIMPTLADANIIKAAYRELLGRDATDSEVQSRLNQPVDQLFWEVASSPERGKLIRTTVQRLYGGSLQRAGSDAEIESWAQVPLSVQLDGICASPEAKAVSAAYNSIPALRSEADALTSKTAELATELAAAHFAPVSDAQAAEIVATKANPLLQFLALVWAKIIKKGQSNG